MSLILDVLYWFITDVVIDGIMDALLTTRGKIVAGLLLFVFIFYTVRWFVEFAGGF